MWYYLMFHFSIANLCTLDFINLSLHICGTIIGTMWYYFLYICGNIFGTIEILLVYFDNHQFNFTHISNYFWYSFQRLTEDLFL